MAQSKRILFVSGDVEPFTQASSIASLARSLPEQVQRAGDYEARIMMPCYGEIDERKHSLHEVIRLSGTDIPMGEETEEVTVKVASVPGVRLQVYFMDHGDYFSREGLFHDEDGAPFADNARRALFFNRAVIETIRTLRWGPDVIHNLGWITSLLPALLATEYAGDDVLGDAKTVFTPDDLDLDVSFTDDEASSLGLSADAANVPVTDLGLQHADASLFPADMTPTSGAEQFVEDEDARGEQAAELYEQMLSEVPA
jgi:starch synthase